MGAMDLDEAAARAKVAALALSDDATRRKVICGLVGHSNVLVEQGDGKAHRVRCARCMEDVTAEVDIMGCVFVGHDACETCRENAAELTWRDTWEVTLGQTDGRA